MIRIRVPLVSLFCALLCAVAFGQECSTGSDIDVATNSAIQQAAQQYAQYAVQGNAQALQQNAVGPLATDISPVQTALANFKPSLTGARASMRAAYLLNYTGQGRPEFYCGIFNSADRIGMMI